MDDRLAELLKHFELQARVFHTGQLCDSAMVYGNDQLGYIHLLKQGELRLESPAHPPMILTEPAAVIYMRSTPHRLIPLTTAVSEVTTVSAITSAPEITAAIPTATETVCAALDFGVGLSNPLISALPELVCIPLHELPALDLALQLLFAEANTFHCGREAMLNRLMEVIFIHLLRDAMDQHRLQVGLLAGLAEPRLAKAINAIHRQPEKNWSLQELAQQAGMSRSNFAARFHAVVGMTPAYYLGEWRITLAQSLLRKGKPIQWISDRVGYANASALARAFRAHRGESPKSWLQKFMHHSA